MSEPSEKALRAADQIAFDWSHNTSGSQTFSVRLATALDAFAAEARAEERERARKMLEAAADMKFYDGATPEQREYAAKRLRHAASLLDVGR